VGIWSLIRRALGQKSQPAPPVVGDRLPELVLLTRKPRVVGEQYVRDAIRVAFGINLPSKGEDDTEFVTGESPIFFCQFDGRLLQIKMAAYPYFDPVSRPFVSGDPVALLQKSTAQGFSKVIAKYKAWVAVTNMSPAVNPSEEDPYSCVAKMLGALAAAEEVGAIIWPAQGAIEHWDDEMMEDLDNGEYAELFAV
jgi:hypothetical protein